METQSREICCCGARCWTLGIGWLIMTLGGIEIIAILINIVGKGEEFRPEHALVILSLVFKILLSIGLINGVYKGQHKMLRAWCVLQGIGLVFGVFLFVGAIVQGQTIIAIVLAVSYPIMIFFIWVVNVHQKEILANQNTGTVPFGKGTGTTGPRLV